jgi:hypothetical protein
MADMKSWSQFRVGTQALELDELVVAIHLGVAVVRFVYYGHSMSAIPSNQEILTLVDEINAQKTSNKVTSTPLPSYSCTGVSLKQISGKRTSSGYW